MADWPCLPNDAPKDSFAKIDKTKTKRTATKYSGKDLFGMVLFILFRMQTSSGTTTRGGGGPKGRGGCRRCEKN